MVTALQMEVDPAKQKQLTSQINDFLLDQSFQMPLAASPTRALASTKLHGVGHRRHDFFLFTDAWLE